STVTDTADLTVNPVNDAPTIATGTSTLANVDSSNAIATPQVTAVSTLATNAGVSDVDTGALQGIAVTGFTTVGGGGAWQYSLDGTTYQAMGAVSGANARLLASTAFVRYLPGANETGTATLTYQAWDQSSGTNGTFGNASVNGGITAFSTASSVATHNVAPVNDAPILDATRTPVLAAVAEDSPVPTGAIGTLVSS